MNSTQNRFSRLAFGGGEEGEAAAHRALLAHEALLVTGANVRVYRGNPEGAVGTIMGEAEGRSYLVRMSDGLTWTIESRNLEVIRYTVMSYDTGAELTGAPSADLVDASVNCAQAEGAVCAYLDEAGVWQHVPDSREADYRRMGHDVQTVYVMGG